MKNKIYLIAFCFFFISINFCFSQDFQNLKNINTQIWAPFTKAYETYDYSLFASIHILNLLRVSGEGNSIKLFSEYIEGYNYRWKNNKRTQTISFRFL